MCGFGDVGVYGDRGRVVGVAERRGELNGGVDGVASADDAPRADVEAPARLIDLAAVKRATVLRINQELAESGKVAAAFAENTVGAGVVVGGHVSLAVEAGCKFERSAVSLIGRIRVGRRKLLHECLEERGRSTDNETIALGVGIGHVEDGSKRNGFGRIVDTLRGLPALRDAGEHDQFAGGDTGDAGNVRAVAGDDHPAAGLESVVEIVKFDGAAEDVVFNGSVGESEFFGLCVDGGSADDPEVGAFGARRRSRSGGR